jgi:YopX protein
MSPLRFRAWHKTELKMWSFSSPCVTCSNPDLRQLVFRQGEENYCDDTLEDQEECIVMQATGLKDSYGTDLYEDDILLDEDTEVRHLIYWNPTKGAWWVKRVAEPDYNQRDYSLVELTEASHDYKNYSCKKLGNIWESPGLLNAS